MTISVIIPAYNSAATILAAMQSVYAQAVPPAELIVVDDLSHDDTVAVVERWVETHSGPFPTRLLRSACNGGPAAARNRGIAAATGDWIAFLDADDAWLPQRLALQMAVVERHPDTIMLCGSTVGLGTEDRGQRAEDGERETDRPVDGLPGNPPALPSMQGAMAFSARPALQVSHAPTLNQKPSTTNPEPRTQNPEPRTQNPTSLKLRRASPAPQLRGLRFAPKPRTKNPEPRTKNPEPPSTPLTLRDFAIDNPVATSTVLVRRDALQAVSGFDEQFRGPEDYDLWIRIAARGEIRKLDMPLACYRHVPGSLSMDDRTFLPQVMRVLDKAFGKGGALSAFPELRRTAESTQAWNASWMAFHRGARGTALKYWAAAYLKNRRTKQPVHRKWGALLVRYLLRQPVHG